VPSFERIALALALAVFAAAPSVSADEPVSFSYDVLPILSDKCFHCHGPDPKHREADLRLDVREAALEHGAFVPGKSGASELVRRIVSTDADEQMPPPASNRVLTKAQIDILKRWIDQGAPWGKHWAFETPMRPEVPKVQAADWPRNPIDAFVLARLEKEKLKPSPEADAVTLCRRLYLDLTGIPPTPEEVDAFVRSYNLSSKDGGTEKRSDGDKAYEALVDKLLASPRYGERWAWDWLDAARYADSSGYQGDPERTMWPWRDWVVRTINADLSYDKFTVEQLAGDLLPQATLEQKIATGFNRNHMFNAEGGRIAEETRVENVMDRAETTGTVWLGLTVGCARCHDHKYDPLTNREYYQLYAYFNNTSESGAGRGGQNAPAVDVATAAERAELDAAEKEARAAAAVVASAEADLFPRAKGEPAGKSIKAADLSGNVIAALNQEPAKRGADALREMVNHYKTKEPAYGKLLEKHKAAVDRRDRLSAKLPRVMVMDELALPRDTFMLEKGAYDKPLDKVTAALPAWLPAAPAAAKNDRLSLARWLVDPRHPLTARVTVNRYWQALFGLGLVKTVEDFGVQGEQPSHPQLLDWLAVEFQKDWSVKRLLKLIVTSATYRQSSKVTPALLERDPDNRLLARGARFRLPSWMIRDGALAAGGLMVERLGGPPVKPYQPEGIWEEATFGKKTYVQDHGEALYRRSLYIFWRRIVGPTMFFDVSARQVCTIKNFRTNTPLHALSTLNDVTFVEAARAMAELALKEGGSSPSDRLAWIFRRATSRRPTAAELKVLEATLDKFRKQYAADKSAAEKLLKAGESPRDEKLDPVEHASYAALCSLVLNLDETLTKQ
jgi:hypothetical protein